MKPYADVLIAWAQGKDVQWRNMDSEPWVDYMKESPPMINNGCQFRIKPEPKPDVVKYINIYPDSGHDTFESSVRNAASNKIGVLKITINGETGKVTAEVCE